MLCPYWCAHFPSGYRWPLLSSLPAFKDSSSGVSQLNGSDSGPYLPLYMRTEGGRQSQWGSPGRSSTSRDLSPVKNRWNREFSGPRLLQHKGLSSCSGTQGTQSAKCLFQPRPEHWIHCVSFVLLEALPRFRFFFYFVQLMQTLERCQWRMAPICGCLTQHLTIAH